MLFAFTFLLSVFCAISLANVEPPTQVVVTANRLNTSEENVASSYTIISSEEIKRKQYRTVTEVLSTVPGLTVSNGDGVGRVSSVFIRGMKSEHTLVLLDGIELNDPLDPARAFNFGNLCVDNIERIEVIRGAQSVLYGSDAIGGVVHIITKKGRGPTQGAAQLEYGAYNSQKAQAEVSGGTNRFNYSLSASAFGTDGHSAADENQGNVEKDGASISSASVRLGAAPLQKLDLVAVARYSDSKYDLDASGGPGGDDPNYKATDRLFYSKIEATAHPFSFWEPIIEIAYSNAKKTTDNAPDANPSFSRTSFDSSRIKAQAQNNLQLSQVGTLALGLESESEKGSSRVDYGSGITSQTDGASTTGFFAGYQYGSNSLFSSLGARWDIHERFGSHGTYRIAPGYKILDTGTTLKASMGTGFKAPSLYQLYSGNGDPSLLPEKSMGYDIGFEQKFSKPEVSMGMTYFRNHLTDLIGFDFATSKYKNMSKLRTQGVEVTASFKILTSLSMNLNYTFTEAREEETGLSALRRPQHQVSSALVYSPLENLETDLLVKYIGKRADIDAVTFGRVEMPGYTLVALTASYSPAKELRLFARLDNLLDKKYQAVNGYGTAGRTFFVGLRREL